MNQIKVIEFLESNKDYLFPNKEYSDMEVESALIAAPDSFEMMMNSIPFRKPSDVQILSFFPGSLGVDRFYLGEVIKGILKYFTFAGLGIWWIADIVSAKKRCRTYNCKKLMAAITDSSVISQMKTTDAKIGSTVDKAKKFAPVAKEIMKGAKDVGKTFYHDS